MKSTDEERQVHRLQRLLGTSLLVLLAASWPLWNGHAEFPQIPWYGWLVGVPMGVDWGLLVVLVASAGMLMVSTGPRAAKWCPSLAWATLSGLLLLDQHRCQPWAWQFWLLLAAWSLADSATSLRCARALVVSIYFWSAVSKIDPGFVSGHGQMLLDGWLNCLGVEGRQLNEQTREAIAWMMPAGELLAAGLLAWPRFRRAGVPLSILLHSGLLMAVGPWGLDHEWGVVLWNVYFVLQNWILFRPVPAGTPTAMESPQRLPRWGNAVAWTITGAALGLPALNSIGWWDHWPSWSVYSAHPAIVRFYVDEARAEELPRSLESLVLPAEPFQTVRQVSLDQWSFRELHVPPYPQERWKLALAAAVMEPLGADHGLRVELLVRRSWWHPERERRVLSAQQLRRALGEFLFNTRRR